MSKNKNQVMETGERLTDAQLAQIFSSLEPKLVDDNQPTINGESKTADAPKEVK